jgi:hypothetical protein
MKRKAFFEILYLKIKYRYKVGDNDSSPWPSLFILVPI